MPHRLAMLSRDEALRLAQKVIDYRTDMVASAHELAVYVQQVEVSRKKIALLVERLVVAKDVGARDELLEELRAAIV